MVTRLYGARFIQTTTSCYHSRRLGYQLGVEIYHFLLDGEAPDTTPVPRLEEGTALSSCSEDKGLREVTIVNL